MVGTVIQDLVPKELQHAEVPLSSSNASSRLSFNSISNIQKSFYDTLFGLKRIGTTQESNLAT